jgi:hypothetical protein
VYSNGKALCCLLLSEHVLVLLVATCSVAEKRAEMHVMEQLIEIVIMFAVSLSLFQSRWHQITGSLMAVAVRIHSTWLPTTPVSRH